MFVDDIYEPILQIVPYKFYSIANIGNAIIL
jgi:hypothetical protein